MVVGRHGDLAAAAGGVDDVLVHGVAGGVAAQPLHDLDALGNRGAEVPGALHQVALVEVVGSHADAHQVLHQLALDVDVVVHARQQHGLVAQRDAGARQFVASLGQFGGDLVGMVDVDVDPQRVVLCEHVGQFVGDAHGHEDRHARADAHDLDVRDLAQAAQDLLQDAWRQHQRVAAGEQHIAHLRCVPQVFELHLELGAREGRRGVAHDARAGAVAAVGGALGGDQHQDAVRVAVHQPGHRGVAVFGQGILHHGGEGHHLGVGGHDLLADGIIGSSGSIREMK